VRDLTIFGIRSNISSKLLELETSNLLHGFVWVMPSTRTNNFHESGRGLGHVTATIFGSAVGYPSDSLASRFYWFVCVSVRVFVCVFFILVFALLHVCYGLSAWNKPDDDRKRPMVMTDDVTWARKVKHVTPIRLEPRNIAKTAACYLATTANYYI